MKKSDKKKLKKKYLKERKEILAKNGFIFEALVGFHNWGADLPDKEYKFYMCNTSSSSDITRWFNEIIYPFHAKLHGESQSKLIEFISLYESGQTDQILAGINGSLVDGAIVGLEENDNKKKFFEVLARLISRKIS